MVEKEHPLTMRDFVEKTYCPIRQLPCRLGCAFLRGYKNGHGPMCLLARALEIFVGKSQESE